MKTNKIIAMAVALMMLLAMVAIPAYADGYSLTIDAPATANSGADYTVNLVAQTSGAKMSCMYVDFHYDKDLFTVKSVTAPKAGDLKQVVEGEGVLGLKTATDMSSYDDENWFVIVLTADEVEEATEAKFSVTPDADWPWQDMAYNELEVELDTEKTVNIVLAHTAPVVNAVITGSGKVGEELSAATSTVVDPWELEPTAVTYSWVIDGKTVSTTDAYKPVAADLGKVITLTVTATVAADDEPTGTGTETVKIVGVVPPASVKAGKDIDVLYAFADEVDVVATAKYADNPKADEDKWKDISAEKITVAGDKVTVATDKSLEGNYVVVTIGPSEGEAFVTAPIEVKKATTKGRTIGNAPSLVGKTTDPGTTEVTDPTDPGTTEVTDPTDPGTSTKTYEKDSIYLTIGSKEVIVFGEVVMSDVAPQIVNDRTMLPARIVAENLGAEVAWDEETRTVTITKGEVTIVITIDSDKALVNGEEFELDSPAFIEDSRTFTPMRFIAEALGATVGWDDATKTVKITPAVVAAE